MDRTFGWDFGPNGTLVENAAEQRIIRWMRRVRAQGKSLREIADTLNERGVKPKCRKRWIHSSVVRILARQAA